jgi:hypothetical protein
MVSIRRITSVSVTLSPTLTPAVEFVVGGGTLAL